MEEEEKENNNNADDDDDDDEDKKETSCLIKTQRKWKLKYSSAFSVHVANV